MFNVQFYPGYPYLGYPYLGYPNAVPNVESVKKNDILTKIADSATEQSTCVCVCHTYMFNVGTQWYVIVYSVK